MIALLTGTIALRSDPYLIVDVHGVGYKVLVSNTVLSKAILHETITLFTYTHVREDTLELYGFTEPEDMRLFEYLISVSGVGCKTALGVFSVGTRSAIIKAIVAGDVSFFTAVPRLGKKNAQKLIIELKSKFGSKEDLDLTTGDNEEEDEAVMALRNFGFSTQEALSAIRAVSGEAKTTSDTVRLALKYLGK